MAAPYTKFFGQSLWAEGSEFRDLTGEEQRVYVVLATQPNITRCGVLPYNPRRWAQLSSDSTLQSFVATLERIAAKDYIVVDRETDELWVRTYIRWDGVINSLNGAKGVARSIEGVLSRSLARRIRATAYELAAALPAPADESKSDPRPLIRSLFEPRTEPPHQPPTKGATEPPSEPPCLEATIPIPVTNHSSNGVPSEPDAFDAAVNAAIAVRRSQTTVTDNDRWEPAARNGIVKDFGRKIRSLLDQGYTPENAGRVAIDAAPIGPIRSAPREPDHPSSCECGGTRLVLVDPEDESRTAPVKRCPVTEWPDASIHTLQGTA